MTAYESQNYHMHQVHLDETRHNLYYTLNNFFLSQLSHCTNLIPTSTDTHPQKQPVMPLQ
jgi:hypothetical protein